MMKESFVPHTGYIWNEYRSIFHSCLNIGKNRHVTGTGVLSNKPCVKMSKRCQMLRLIRHID